MLVKAYKALWAAIILAAAALCLYYGPSYQLAVPFGFIAFGMTFMGMINVLPYALTHAQPEAVAEPAMKPAQTKCPAVVAAGAFRGEAHAR